MSNSKPDPNSDATVAAQPPSLPPVTVTGAETFGGAPTQPPTTTPRFGDFVLLGELGHGGMGVVYRAEDPRLKREVAIKVMLPQFAVNPQAKARFVREARAQAKVEHDHVVAILHIADHDGLPYIVMPLLKGMTLQAALKANPRPPLPEVIRIGREVAEGLAAAHEKGLVHRDIKPANVWLEGKKLRVKVLDFGLARTTVEVEATEASEGPVTNVGAIVGTPAYMSPEQGRGLPLDGRTDLWSLGVMLYQMTTGELPFGGVTSLAILTSLAFDNPPPPIAKNPAVPQSLSDFVMRLLAKDPAYRPPTAEIAADELRAIEGGLVNAVRVIPLDSPPPLILATTGPDPFAELDATEENATHDAEPVDDDEPINVRTATKPRGGFPMMWALVGAVLLAVAGVVGFVASQMGKKPEEVVKEDPPKLTPPTRTVKKDKPLAPGEAERQVAELFNPYASLGLRLGTPPQDLLVKPGDPLPAEPFVIHSIALVNTDIPAAAAAKLLSSVSRLSSLSSYVDQRKQLHWSDDQLGQLAASPVRDTLVIFETDFDPSPKAWEALKRFRFVNLNFSGSRVTNESIAGLPQFGEIRQLVISALGMTGKLTPESWSKLLNFTRIEYLVLSSPLGLDTAVGKLIAGLPGLQGLTVANCDLDAANIQELSKCPKLTSLSLHGVRPPDLLPKYLAGLKLLSQLDLHQTELSPGTIESLATLTQLQGLWLKGTGATEAQVKLLNAALPRCTITWDKGTAEPSEPHFREAIRLLARSAVTVGVRPTGGKDLDITNPNELPDGPFILTRVALRSNNPPFTDDDLKRLEATPTLVSVAIPFARITDAGFRSLLTSKQTIDALYLKDASLTDKSLEALAEFANLGSLNCGAWKITDDGLKHLAALPVLKVLFLEDTAASDAGVQTLSGMTGSGLWGSRARG